MRAAASKETVAYRLAKLIKHIDNRLCADCSEPLLEWQNYAASLTDQVWLCHTCYDIHVEVLGEAKVQGKRIKDEWSEKDITQMEKAVSNLAKNKIYERFVSNDWKKITPDSPNLERVHWIKAKYLSRYFSIPPILAARLGGPARKHSSRDIGYASTLPMRTADYFITLGPGKAKSKVTGGRSVTEIFFSTEVVSSFPDERFYTDHSSPIPDLLGPMVFPNGLTLSKREERPYSFTFVLTDVHRVKQFGAVLIVHELIDPLTLHHLMPQRRNSIQKERESSRYIYDAEQSSPQHNEAEQDEVLYAPKALVVLSHYPFFHLFSRFLEQIYHLSLSVSALPIERYIANFM